MYGSLLGRFKTAILGNKKMYGGVDVDSRQFIWARTTKVTRTVRVS